MGTSSSSSGPGAGVSLDPPWLSAVASELENPLGHISGEVSQPVQSPPLEVPDIKPEEVAPPRRFSNARRYLGEYIRGGNKETLKKALGNYSRTGMGGATNVATRMRASTSAGAGLFTFLQGVRDSTNIQVRAWVDQLTARNLSAYEVTNEIIDQVISSGGSLEEESCRNSMAQAISDLLIIDPDINLMNMDNENIWTVLELFIANEAFNRLNLDIGQLFESAKYSPAESVRRMNEMREFLKSEISAQVQDLRIDAANPTKDEINNLLQSAIRITFEVFEVEL